MANRKKFRFLNFRNAVRRHHLEVRTQDFWERFQNEKFSGSQKVAALCENFDHQILMMEFVQKISPNVLMNSSELFGEFLFARLTEFLKAF